MGSPNGVTIGECKPTHVKREYTRQRRLRGQKSYRASDKWKNCWRRAANVINGLNCDVREYIHAQFEATYPFPHPNNIYNTRAVSKYKEYKVLNRNGPDSGMKRDAEKRYEIMMDLLERKVNIGFEPITVLKNRQFGFTPLFRVAAANHLVGHTEDVKEFEDLALEEYKSHPYYKRLYGRFLPGWEVE